MNRFLFDNPLVIVFGSVFGNLVRGRYFQSRRAMRSKQNLSQRKNL
jgi:hypothetical protein